MMFILPAMAPRVPQNLAECQTPSFSSFVEDESMRRKTLLLLEEDLTNR